MTRPSTLIALDGALDGKVTALLLRRSSEGRTAPQIRDELRDKHGIAVSDRTVQRWLSALADPTPEPAA